MQRILLVIDDEIEIGRLILRSLRRTFDEIHLATTVREAEQVLESGKVTHLVCDMFLGQDSPLGDVLVGRWRKRWPGIRSAVIFTGSTCTMDCLPPGVDDVYYKPGGFDDLIDLLNRQENAA